MTSKQSPSPSASATNTPERTTPKLPPRNPRRSLSRRSGSGVKTSSDSRHSSSSPEKAAGKGQAKEDFLSRLKSSSPSPVRAAAPVPVPASPANQHSDLYSSSFGSPASSSNHSSPAKSPLKSSPSPVKTTDGQKFSFNDDIEATSKVTRISRENSPKDDEASDSGSSIHTDVETSEAGLFTKQSRGTDTCCAPQIFRDQLCYSSYYLDSYLVIHWS